MSKKTTKQIYFTKPEDYDFIYKPTNDYFERPKTHFKKNNFVHLGIIEKYYNPYK